MGRHNFLEAKWQSAEDQAQALRHAKDAVDRSAWFLALLRKELSGAPCAGYIRRLRVRGLLADLRSRQALLSSKYSVMTDMPPGSFLGMQLKAFFLAYDRFLDAVHAARVDSRKDYETGPSTYSVDPFQIRRELPINAVQDEICEARSGDKA